MTKYESGMFVLGIVVSEGEDEVGLEYIGQLRR